MFNCIFMHPFDFWGFHWSVSHAFCVFHSVPDEDFHNGKRNIEWINYLILLLDYEPNFNYIYSNLPNYQLCYKRVICPCGIYVTCYTNVTWAYNTFVTCYINITWAYNMFVACYINVTWAYNTFVTCYINITRSCNMLHNLNFTWLYNMLHKCYMVI